VLSRPLFWVFIGFIATLGVCTWTCWGWDEIVLKIDLRVLTKIMKGNGLCKGVGVRPLEESIRVSLEQDWERHLQIYKLASIGYLASLISDLMCVPNDGSNETTFSIFNK
jgi:hypothetical protein